MHNFLDLSYDKKLFQKNIIMSRSEQIKKAITNYLNSIKELKQLGIIKTNPSLGDIGEFLCLIVYPGLELAESPINPGFDALFNGKKIQIKFTDSSLAGNFNVGDPNNYDELIFITGPNSCHRNPSESSEKKDLYLFYRYSSTEVIEKFKTDSGYYISKTKHFKLAERVWAL